MSDIFHQVSEDAVEATRRGLAAALRLARENEKLRDRIEALEKALEDAIESIEAWGAYASEYFKDKHDLEGDIARARSALQGKGG